MKTFATLFTISALIWRISSQQEPVQPPTISVQAIDPLNQVVGSAQLTDETIFAEVARLNQSFDISISIEGILPKTGTVTNPRFTATIEHQTIEKVLDWLCSLDPRYTWIYNNDAVNIFPRTALSDGRYFFNRTLPELNFRDVREVGDAAMEVVHQVGDPNEQLYFMGIGGVQQFAQPWTATFHDITVRQALNKIAQHLGPTYGWQIGGTEDQRLIMFHYKLGGHQLKSLP